MKKTVKSKSGRQLTTRITLLIKVFVNRANALLFFCLALSSLFSSTVMAVEGIHGKLSIGSGYVFRGLQYSGSGLAYSGYLEKNWQNGIYAGLWAARYNADSYPERNSEVNYLLGYNLRLSPKIVVDTAVIRYEYSLDTATRNYDWTEWQTSLYLYDRIAINYGLGRGWFSKNDTTHFGQLSYSFNLPLNINLDVSVGKAFIEHRYINNYQFMSLGIARSFGDFIVRGQVSQTDSTIGEALSSDVANTQATLDISWSF